MRAAIAGHKDLWFCGVLHGDICPGNILITPEDENRKLGCLVYHDQENSYKRWITPSAMQTDDAKIARLIQCAKEDYDLDITNATALKLLAYFRLSESLGVLEEALKIWKEVIPDIVVTVPEPNLSWPNCDDVSRDIDVHTGTAAFTSGELSGRFRRPYEYGFGRGHIIHGVIHDIESFFWVLVYLCLTRTGEGRLRPELLQDPPEDDTTNRILHTIVYYLFDMSDDDVVKSNKTDFFQQPGQMNEYIIASFHPDMACLKPLMLRWWDLLVFTYRTYNHLTSGVIHSQVLKLFDDTLKDVQQQFGTGPPDGPLTGGHDQPASAAEGRDDNDLLLEPAAARGINLQRLLPIDGYPKMNFLSISGEYLPRQWDARSTLIPALKEATRRNP
ncbi:hypothetical protein PUNSTDRAFT_137811 [Punctularia strigosozonata HHB-11173 SS5]|uniref:Uncharacterized protein n=1 Tax=Punctularia strigosozonata (strain HHB-11173) TaxID=741275 RepID=R7S5D1_PUNST|nr:uncharacterized protein PUNSTDRAFT_137811 [Punctularia strigosozonata HHB-11173 SS5]EIN05127.1 hypothetical protein PUNSTDRAFT_137811 [Punctularia strigosozonata HHB-11173 SS5]